MVAASSLSVALRHILKCLLEEMVQTWESPEVTDPGFFSSNLTYHRPFQDVPGTELWAPSLPQIRMLKPHCPGWWYLETRPLGGEQVLMRSWYVSLMGLLLLKEETPEGLYALSTCECSAGKWPSASQEEVLTRTGSCLAPWSLTSSL